MRRVVIVTGVLGAGTALTFAAAIAAASLFPNGTLVSAQGWSPVGVSEKGWIGPAVEMPDPRWDTPVIPGVEVEPIP